MGEITSLPVEIATIKLVIEDENTAITAARNLIAKTQQRQLLQLIETILVYKFPRMNIQEIEEMFGLSDLKQTRVYQEGREEGKEEGRTELQIESIPRLLKLGLSVEQIAQALDLNVQEVRQQIEKQNTQ